ncbi:hypothetical protein F5Y04DRAFT_11663 [Hypomontagnella monticulosa]|nr:hypothetical protein F5Y04DRAFT_11663 [Hypomontagnella monticulosa]
MNHTDQFIEACPGTTGFNPRPNDDEHNRNSKLADAAGEPPINFIIGISGCSSAGKTTLSLLLDVVLRKAFHGISSCPPHKPPDVTVIHQDTYFLQHIPHPQMVTIRPRWPEDRLVAHMAGPDDPLSIRVEDRDCVSCCDVELLTRHVEEPGARPSGYDIPAPDVAPATPEVALGGLEAGTLEKVVEGLQGVILRGEGDKGDSACASAVACRVTIVEGFTLLARDTEQENTDTGSEARNLRALRELQERLDVALFLPVNHDEARARRFRRRKYRDEPEGYRKPGEFWKCAAYFDQVAWPHYERYHKYILSNLADAYARRDAGQQDKDLCIDGTHVRPPGAISVDDTLIWAVRIVGTALAARLWDETGITRGP